MVQTRKFVYFIHNFHNLVNSIINDVVITNGVSKQLNWPLNCASTVSPKNITLTNMEI